MDLPAMLNNIVWLWMVMGWLWDGYAGGSSNFSVLKMQDCLVSGRVL